MQPYMLFLTIFSQQYEVILKLIPPWLLMTLAALVAAGWIWRLHKQIAFAPPKAAKISSAIGFGGVAAFYAMEQFYDPPLVVSVAMIRVIWLFLIANELTQHIYIYQLARDVRNAKRN